MTVSDRTFRLVIAAAVFLGLMAGTMSADARPATSEETAALQQAFDLGTDSTGEISVTIADAEISRINPTWAAGYAEAILPDGQQLERATVVFWFGQGTWWVQDYGTGLGPCGYWARQGVPARVVDELGISGVTYSCARPPKAGLGCVVRNSGGEPRVVYRRRAVRCGLSLDGTALPANYQYVELRAMRWRVATRSRAVVTAGAIPNHYPLDPYRVRVVLSRPVETYCGPQFTRATVTSRWGTSRGKVPIGSCQ